MSLTDYKITDEAIAQNGVCGAPDKLTGTAAQNKAVFDRLVRESVKGVFNSVVDTLAGTGGAAAVGTAPITGVTGGDVQTALASLKVQLDAKSDRAGTDMHIKGVTFNSATGVLTFTHEDGSHTVIDTALEKVATNWRYDAQTQSLVLTLADGTTQSVPLSAFITETEFTDSSQIAFSVSNHQVTATVKPGSITDTLLGSSLVTQLQGYAASASTSAASAALSQSGASAAATSARSYAVGGTASRAGEDTDNAKYYCEQAGVAASSRPKGDNLLDNWYFVGGGSQTAGGLFPINQKLQTSYLSETSLTIDRWRHVNNGTCAIQSDCIRLTQNTANPFAFKQLLEKSVSGQVTFSVLVKSVTGTWSVTSTASSGALSGGPLVVGLNSFTGTPQALSGIGVCATNQGDRLELIAVKLELGGNQTLARETGGAWVLMDPPPSPTLELLKCQRFFQIFRTQSFCPTYAVDFRPVMRENPALGLLAHDNVTYYTAAAEL